ncbi:hypothetical protein NDU88_000373 [Pleurodeles waltl]|uniref:Uncharacterized protein n=1 Tax=Pleurodeles waltl TaxID=8319 RepID=A0AAV7NA95_PLEWA|nr:hypothetical protein NDU88_000373 [Pleurodeles waltl]
MPAPNRDATSVPVTGAGSERSTVIACQAKDINQEPPCWWLPGGAGGLGTLLSGTGQTIPRGVTGKSRRPPEENHEMSAKGYKQGCRRCTVPHPGIGSAPEGSGNSGSS